MRSTRITEPWPPRRRKPQISISRASTHMDTHEHATSNIFAKHHQAHEADSRGGRKGGRAEAPAVGLKTRAHHARVEQRVRASERVCLGTKMSSCAVGAPRRLPSPPSPSPRLQLHWSLNTLQSAL
jgi:hypothetical protein